MTVTRMITVNGGFRNPKDIRPSPVNPRPHAGQLEPNEFVERSRRLNPNDLESIPAFLVAGLLCVLSGPCVSWPSSPSSRTTSAPRFGAWPRSRCWR